MKNRAGDYIQTFAGIKYYPLDPLPEEVSREDIAHALSLKCRFGGMCREFYSVAEHSIRVADYLDKKYNEWELTRIGLMHDAAEAYVSDVLRPIKSFIPRFSEIEKMNEQAICERFKIDYPLDIRYKEADNRWLITEAKQLLDEKLVERWNFKPSPILSTELHLQYGVDLPKWGPKEAEKIMLEWMDFYNIN